MSIIYFPGPAVATEAGTIASNVTIEGNGNSPT
jgi:hypothetical protein